MYFGEDSVFIVCALFVGDERPPELSKKNVSSGGNAKAFVVSNMYPLLREDDETSIMSVSCVSSGVEVRANGVFRVCSVSFGNGSKSRVFVTLSVYGSDNELFVDCDS